MRVDFPVTEQMKATPQAGTRGVLPPRAWLPALRSHVCCRHAERGRTSRPRVWASCHQPHWGAWAPHDFTHGYKRKSASTSVPSTAPHGRHLHTSKNTVLSLERCHLGISQATSVTVLGGTKGKAVLATFPSLVGITCGGKHGSPHGYPVLTPGLSGSPAGPTGLRSEARLNQYWGSQHAPTERTEAPLSPRSLSDFSSFPWAQWCKPEGLLKEGLWDPLTPLALASSLAIQQE